MTESIRHLITLHAQRERGEVIGVGVHLYINVYIGMFVDKTTTLNRTSAIDSPLQTFMVGLLIEFIDYIYHCFLQKHFPRRVNQRFSYIMRTLLYLSGWMTQLPAQAH